MWCIVILQVRPFGNYLEVQHIKSQDNSCKRGGKNVLQEVVPPLLSALATIVVAVIAYIGNRKGAAEGIRQSNQMVEYRLKQLEEKVAKHNSVVERTFKLEEKMENVESAVDKYDKAAASTSRLEEKVEVANHRIADLEHFQDKWEEVRIEH